MLGFCLLEKVFVLFKILFVVAERFPEANHATLAQKLPVQVILRRMHVLPVKIYTAYFLYSLSRTHVRNKRNLANLRGNRIRTVCVCLSVSLFLYVKNFQ